MARYSDDMPSWYIDAKELWKMMIQRREQNKELSCAFTMNIGVNQAVGLMNSLPPVDAVKVVRCKDCKYGEFVDDGFFLFLCRYHGSDWNDGGHFCSYGERKDND